MSNIMIDDFSFIRMKDLDRFGIIAFPTANI